MPIPKIPPPSCLNSFRPKLLSREEADFLEMNSDLFTRYELVCPCGGNLFDIVHYSEYDECPTSPLYARCKQCGRKELLFDSDLHGHDAMIGDPILSKGTNEETVWTCPDCHQPGRIILVFGYQYCEEDFAELSATGQIEDYFDALLVFHLCQGSGVLHSVACYECA